MLSLILVALIAMGASCNRPPQPQPTQQGLNGEITTETITSETGAEGYSLSYRSWIIPGTDENGEKAPTPPKSVYNDNASGGLGNASNSFERGGGVSETKSLAYDGKGGGHSDPSDTISVILHDTFYNVDTVGYVTTWDPDKYVQGSYTCHWDKYGLPRSGEDNVIITDSTIVLRVQFEEFSFQYRINFETATYRDGVVNIPFPHHTPVITDLGVEELVDSLSICPDGQNVYARKLLQHSIRVSIGNKDYVLKAKVMLHRSVPNADPNKFVLWSEFVEPFSTTFFTPADSMGGDYNELYTAKLLLHYSDGSTTQSVVRDSTYMHMQGGSYYENNHPFSPSNLPDLSSYNLTYNGARLIVDYGNNIIGSIALDGYTYTSPPTITQNNICTTAFGWKREIYYDGYTSIYASEIPCTIELLPPKCYIDYNYSYITVSSRFRVSMPNHPPQEIVSHYDLEF